MLQSCYHICQYGTGGHTQRARPIEALSHSQGNLEEKGKGPRTTNTGQIIMHICKNETQKKDTLKSTPHSQLTIKLSFFFECPMATRTICSY